MATDHGLSHIVPTSRLGWVSAVCACGWRTPEFRNSGLAESLLDAHVDQERARDMWINSSMILLQTRAQRSATARDRVLLAEVMDRVRGSGPIRRGLDPTSPDVAGLVAVDGDDSRLEELTRAVHQQGEMLVVGRGRSLVDAVALTIVERPRVVLIGDRTEQFDHRRDVDLVRDVSPDTRICLYSDGPTVDEGADLVLDKSLPVERVVAHLNLLAG